MKKIDIKRLSNSALIAACEELGVLVSMDRQEMIRKLGKVHYTYLERIKFPEDMLLPEK